MKALTQSFIRILCKIGAISCIVLGVIGAFLPVLPTTPFLILATVFSYNSSPKLRQWLLEHPVFGDTIQNYLENRTISVSALRSALITLWTGLILSIWLVQKLWVSILLGTIGLLVSIYLLRLRRTR